MSKSKYADPLIAEIERALMLGHYVRYGKTCSFVQELEKVQKEVERYREFDRLCQELVMVNEQICQLRPARILADEDELEQLKKNCGGVSPRGGSGSRPPDWAHARRPPAAWPSGFGSQRNSDSGSDASIGWIPFGEVAQ